MQNLVKKEQVKEIDSRVLEVLDIFKKYRFTDKYNVSELCVKFNTKYLTQNDMRNLLRVERDIKLKNIGVPFIRVKRSGNGLVIMAFYESRVIECYSASGSIEQALIDFAD